MILVSGRKRHVCIFLTCSLNKRNGAPYQLNDSIIFYTGVFISKSEDRWSLECRLKPPWSMHYVHGPPGLNLRSILNGLMCSFGLLNLPIGGVWLQFLFQIYSPLPSILILKQQLLMLKSTAVLVIMFVKSLKDQCQEQKAWNGAHSQTSC